MAFDGITIKALVKECNDLLINGRVQKIAQPEQDEIIFNIKNNGRTYRLLISANASLPLFYLTENNKPSPLTAPNFCMLLRKHLSSAKILNIEQIEFERVVKITFENYNELGDLVNKDLYIEIMGKHSNIIFVENDIIIDSIKHVNGLVSSIREVLPNRDYFIPNTLYKVNPMNCDAAFFNTNIFNKADKINKLLTKTFTGISSVFANEIAYRAKLDGDASIQSLNGNERSSLISTFIEAFDKIKACEFSPCIIYKNNEPYEFGALNYEMLSDLNIKKFESISKVVESFYSEKEIVNRIRQKSTDLRKTVNTLLERSYKKKSIQLKQFKDTEKMDKFKVYGELVNTYGYQLASSQSTLECTNFYDNTIVKIPIDTSLSVAQNANKYFNKYNKLKRTKEALDIQLKENDETISHLESILVALDFARNEQDLKMIRNELSDSGYTKKITNSKKNKKTNIKSEPLHFISSEGFDIYVGRNNYQNDELTFKFANGGDWWFHAKQMPGSHVILKTKGEMPSDKAFEEAASLAAFFSKGKNASKVEIDYTQRKNIKKPSGAKPGFVVYYTNYSIIAQNDLSNLTAATKLEEAFLHETI